MMAVHWRCTYLFWWKSQKSLGGKKKIKKIGWQEAKEIVYFVPLWEVWQPCPLSKGFLSLLVLWLPVDTALPRRVLLSRGANEFLGSEFCSCFVLWHALSSDRSIVLPIKVIYGSQEAGRTPCPHGFPCPCWGLVMSNIAVVLWLPQGGYLNSCRLLGKAIHTTHPPPSDHKYLELAAHSQYQLRWTLAILTRQGTFLNDCCFLHDESILSPWRTSAYADIIHTISTPKCPNWILGPSLRNRFGWHFTWAK